MAKARTVFRCSACGWESSAYEGRCGGCRAWNTLEEQVRAGTTGTVMSPARAVSSTPAARTVLLSEVSADSGIRLRSGLEEFDNVLGGGIPPAGVVLLGGEPGIGKSTLALQAAAAIANTGATVAYICGEEAPSQIRLRAERLGLGNVTLHLIGEPDLTAALAAAQGVGAVLTIVDSVQAVTAGALETRPGGPAQVAGVGAMLVEWAKRSGCAVLATGHVTKTGDIAGPRLLEHLVDAVLYFESAESGALRLLRAVKNRFGATNEVGVFEMTAEGLQSVANPVSALLEGAESGASGCAPTAVVEGTRPLAIEVQALAVPSSLANPRRIASGIETARLHLLLAVLERRGGLKASNSDVIATVTGGLRTRDPGADLAIVAALASAITDTPLPPSTAFVGEVALSGSVRSVPRLDRRVAELVGLGFRRVITPESAEGPCVQPVATVRELLAAVNR